MATVIQVLQSVGSGALVAGIVLLCLAAVTLSCLSISGTWLVVLAGVLAGPVRGEAFPGWPTISVFVVLSALVEGAEALAGVWGVKRRGGSNLAGVMAVIGGLVGAVLGSAIPVPVVGSLLGMLAGSFALAFLVEWRRLRAHNRAASIAMGTVVARVLVILVKVTVTLGMAVYLLGGMLLR